MPITQDHSRFRDIIRGRIKQNFKKYVSQGEMIGKQEEDYVKIPIPTIEIPRFKYGPKNQGGVGQGEGQSGEGVEGEPQEGEGQAGDQPGQHVLEVDVSLDELADILGEELELPKIQPKGSRIQSEARRYTSGLRHFKASYKEALKRMIASGQYDPNKPLVVPIKKDMRYRTFRPTEKPQANAVVIYIMDVSGSMGAEQKEIVRLESFWINTWLKKHYKGLDTRFIIHDAAAKEVDEKTFFSTSESGGTLISSAYNLCKKIIDEDYPSSDWNIYPFHFSDGDNWSAEDTRYCIKLLKDSILAQVNMFCYGQVESKYGSGQFLKDLKSAFDDEELIITSRIESKDKILDSIKEFLGKGN